MRDVKPSVWRYAVGAVAAFALAAVLLEGPASKQLENRDNELIASRFNSKQKSAVLTEDRVRIIVRDELNEDLRPLQQQLAEIRRMLPLQKPKAPPRNTPTP